VKNLTQTKATAVLSEINRKNVEDAPVVGKKQPSTIHFKANA
jgi:hypothetical protein